MAIYFVLGSGLALKITELLLNKQIKYNVYWFNHQIEQIFVSVSVENGCNKPKTHNSRTIYSKESFLATFISLI